jgi:hypothetical protein
LQFFPFLEKFTSSNIISFSKNQVTTAQTNVKNKVLGTHSSKMKYELDVLPDIDPRIMYGYVSKPEKDTFICGKGVTYPPERAHTFTKGLVATST